MPVAIAMLPHPPAPMSERGEFQPISSDSSALLDCAVCQELCGSDSCLPLSASGYSLHREYYLALCIRSAASATVACPKYRTQNASRAVDEFSCCAFVDDGHPAAVAARHSLWMDATGVGAPSTSALLVSTILCATGCRDQPSPSKQRALGPNWVALFMRGMWP